MNKGVFSTDADVAMPHVAQRKYAQEKLLEVLIQVEANPIKPTAPAKRIQFRIGSRVDSACLMCDTCCDATPRQSHMLSENASNVK